MIFRLARRDEIPQLASLRQQQLQEEGQQPDCSLGPALESFFQTMMDRGQLVEYVAEGNGTIIATGAVCFYDFPPSFSNPSGKIAYVTNMYTHPDFRRQGISTKMLELLAQECRLRGVHRSLLISSIWGKSVYEAYGYQPESNWYSFWLK